ncbi:hypothetical protein EDC96DRAFT_611781 [Choanephora cucurbitarum]|nr:hypothetical protein EDC96DRAFT_611781 [Choanephora cucurbitarum]
MSSRRKGKRKAQAFRYDPESTRVNNPPVLRWVSQSKRPFGEVESEGPSSRKRIKGKGREDDGMLLKALHNEMQRRLEAKIRNALNSDEKGVVTDAESNHGFPAGSIERYIRGNRATKNNHQHWVDHVQDAFHNTVENMRAQLATPTVSEPHTPVTEAQGFIVEQQPNQEKRRTFTMAMRQIIRKDLKPDVKDHFIKTLNEAIENSHLQIIHSAYFGPIGTKQDTLNKNPITKAFVDTMPPREDEKCTVDTYLMKKAYSMYFRLAIPKGKLKQQEKPNLIDDDNNELLDLMNLAEELPAAEGRILELEDNATQDNNGIPEEE